MITQKTIQEVINTARVEDVVSDFVNLKRNGANLKGNCPFHDEKTPSFIVSPSKNIYKCFGCGKGGDPVRFIMDHEKMSFPESIKFLAEKYKIEIEETESSAEEKEKKLVTDSLYIVNDYAKEYFIDVLFNRSEGKNIGLSYFKERGFRESTIKMFELGYATEDRDEFTKKAVDKKYNIEYLHTLGLTTKSDYDFFRSRVMFPIHNVSGKIVAFAGRTLSSDKKQPKYINSPESEIYNKRSVLYGLYFARDAIRKADECILVEGYTDVITLHQGGIQNVVASSGTSLTKEQIQLIQRFTPNIKILYDGDPAGIKAALRGLDLVLEANMNVKLVLLPDGQDPDSFLALKGSSDFVEYLDSHQEDFVFFKTRVLLQESGNDPIQKAATIRDIVNSIAKIPDTFKRTLYIRQCSAMLEMSESILVDEVNKVIRSDLKNKKFNDRLPTPATPNVNEEEWLKSKPRPYADDQAYTSTDAWQERAVCSIIVNYGHKIYEESIGTTVADYIINSVTELIKYFDIELYKNILTKVRAELNEKKCPDQGWYISHEDAEIRTFSIDALSTPYTYASWEAKEMILQTQKMPDENFIRDADSAVMRLQLRKSQHIIKDLQQYFLDAADEEKESQEYQINLKVMQVLISQRNELAGKLGTVTL